MNQLPDGTLTNHPIGRETALKTKSHLYVDIDSCDKCTRKYPVKYTKSKNCTTCRHTQTEAINDYVLNGTLLKQSPTDDMSLVITGLLLGNAYPSNNPRMCKTFGHLLFTNKEGRCYVCDQLKYKYNSRDNAIKRGDKWYTPDSPCEHCDTVALKRIYDGRCQGCHPVTVKEASPRQQAIKAGDKWYMPDKPCNRCDTIALTRVYDSRCQGCHPVTVKEASPRQQAIKRGDKWYMPDKPCNTCHTVALTRVYDGRCQGCRSEMTSVRELTPRQQAAKDKQPTYTPTRPCNVCDTFAPRRTKTTICTECVPLIVKGASPRQLAIKAGEDWYTPTTPCPRCGTTSLKRVNNSECKGCN